MYRQAKYRDRNRAHLLKYLQNHPCVDCGEKDPVVLEFDHKSDKKQEIVQAAIARRWGLEKLDSEIAKCEVRCANCHRRKTAKEQGCFKVTGK